DRTRRPYHLMTLRYVERHDPVEVAHRLAISRSQYYREHESAITAVASLLRERGWSEPAPAPVAVGQHVPSPRRRWRRASLAAIGVAAVAIVALIAVRTPSAAIPPTVASPSTVPSPPTAPRYVLSIYAGDGQSGHVNGP